MFDFLINEINPNINHQYEYNKTKFIKIISRDEIKMHN